MQDSNESQPYKARGRKLLMVDELPQSALAKYERDVQVKSYVIGRRGVVSVSEPYAPIDILKEYMMKWMSSG
jgi:hypothetical protein